MNHFYTFFLKVTLILTRTAVWSWFRKVPWLSLWCVPEAVATSRALHQDRGPSYWVWGQIGGLSLTLICFSLCRGVSCAPIKMEPWNAQTMEVRPGVFKPLVLFSSVYRVQNILIGFSVPFFLSVFRFLYPSVYYYGITITMAAQQV